MHRLAYAIYMLMIASAGVTFVFLEDIESDYGLPAWGIGLISSLAFITILFSSLVFAPLGDRGHIRLIGAAGIALTIAGNAWIGFATELWSLGTSRALVGVGTGMFSVAARKALIGDTVENSGERIGALLSAAVAGFIAGPGIGAWLAEWGGIETPYLVIAVLLTVLALPVIVWLGSATIAMSDTVSLRSMLPLLRRPKARVALACQAAVFFNLGVFDSTVDEYLTGFGLDNIEVGFVLIIIGLPLIILPPWAGRLVDRSPRPVLFLLAATAAFVPIILSMGVWAVLAVFVVLAVIETTTESFIFPAAAKVVAIETGAAESAVGQAMLDAVGQTVGAIAAFTAPIMFDLTGGPLGSFGMSAAFAAVMITIAAREVFSPSTSITPARVTGG